MINKKPVFVLAILSIIRFYLSMKNVPKFTMGFSGYGILFPEKGGAVLIERISRSVAAGSFRRDHGFSREAPL